MSTGSTELWQVLLVIVQALIALAGFIGALMINRLIKSIDKLSTEDNILHDRITSHREDMLANYVRHDQMEAVKRDLIGRVDRFELAVTRLFTEADKRYSDAISDLKSLITAHFKG